jgi:hypothetical protein
VLACIFKQQYASAGWSAVYGGAVLGSAAVIGIATAPVSTPVVAAVGIIGGNALVGSLVGAGSSFITRVSDQARFNEDPLVSACVRERSKQLQQKFLRFSTISKKAHKKLLKNLFKQSNN